MKSDFHRASVVCNLIIYAYLYFISFLKSCKPVNLSYVTYYITYVPVCSVTQSCLTLCDPMDCSTPGLPVHYQLRELTQTHIHQVGDAIQPSHPLSSPSLLAFNLSQRQGLFTTL